MNLNHLIVFVTVAKTGSMSETARRLYRSQPAISQVIRDLEERYQVQLFERLGRRLYITPAGNELLKYAYRVTDQFNQMEQAMSNTPHSLSLRIGASITVGTCMLPQLVRRIEERIENIQIHSYVTNTRHVEEMLLKAELDIGLVEGDIHAPELVVTPVVEDYLVLVCGKSHPFFSRQRIVPRDLQNQKFAFRENGSGTRLLFEEYLKRRNLSVNVCCDANCPRTILNMVLEDNALAVMSVRLVQQDIENGNVRVFRNETGEWDRAFKLVYHQDKLLGSEIKSLKSILDDYRHLSIPACATAILAAEDSSL